MKIVVIGGSGKQDARTAEAIAKKGEGASRCPNTRQEARR
jgi:hypothetical protein